MDDVARVSIPPAATQAHYTYITEPGGRRSTGWATRSLGKRVNLCGAELTGADLLRRDFLRSMRDATWSARCCPNCVRILAERGDRAR